MELTLTILFALLGMCVGSFLNVVADRLPEGESIVFPASHCPECGHPLSATDLIPVASYLFLGGRCHYCSAPIPKRVFVVEALTAVIFAFLFLTFGLTLQLAVNIFYFSLFLVLMVIDLEHTIIPNKIVYPAAVIALIISSLTPGMRNIGAPSCGGGTGFIIFLAIAIVSRGGMGLGDVKMATLIGFISGFPLVFVSLFLAVILGGLIAIALLVTRVRKLKEGIPFAPYLSLATMITLLWGKAILDWYLRIYF